jgi:RNA polymerase sigma-70 factor (ECF subfamily)
MASHPGAFDPQSIIAAILRGETDLFRLLVREYGLFVRGYLAARLHHLEDVDDVAQEVFLVAFDRLKTCDPAQFRGWLIGIAKNELRQHWRKQGRRAAAMERFREEVAMVVEAEVDASFHLLRAEHIERLLDCISRLPDRVRRIVRAGLDGCRADELANELGMNRNAIYQARFRGFAALRKCMETGGLDLEAAR